MAGRIHEIRDPIHVFIRVDSDERRVLDTESFQRLREIHQLAMTYLVYPGATHRRFEHSLGVMELATRIFDVAMTKENMNHGSVRRFVRDPEYWRIVLRMAALCHDMGHLPFSHAAELELLPEGWTHEQLSLEIIRSPELVECWKRLGIETEDVAKLAVGPKKYPVPLNDWETILAEIIVSDVFGADRMDYLLRDSYHAGVAYGRFDHHRLIDTIRILPKEEDGSQEPALGIEQGGLQSAESLLWARYLMFTQLYFHPVRRVYDIHLKDFLKEWVHGGKFSTDVKKHLGLSDTDVLVALKKAATDDHAAGHSAAKAIVRRNHFHKIYERNPADDARNPQAFTLVSAAVLEKYGQAAVRIDSVPAKGGKFGFPVLTKDGRVINSLSLSKTLNDVPTFSVDYVFVDPERAKEATAWLDQERGTIIPAVQ